MTTLDDELLDAEDALLASAANVEAWARFEAQADVEPEPEGDWDWLWEGLRSTAAFLVLLVAIPVAAPAVAWLFDLGADSGLFRYLTLAWAIGWTLFGAILVLNRPQGTSGRGS